jgi:hypothetical protein
MRCIAIKKVTVFYVSLKSVKGIPCSLSGGVLIAIDTFCRTGNIITPCGTLE